MPAAKRRSSRLMRLLKGVFVAAGIYYVLAYLVLPRLWYHHEHQPGLAAKPAVTTTPS